jgi:hypothetical protein
MIYELIDMETGNVLGAYETEDSALRFVRDLVVQNDAMLFDAVALVCDDDLGRGTVLAEGAALVKRAGALAA